MVASRIRVMGAFCPARFWLSACCAALMPTSIGYQDLAALIAHHHDAGSAWREHLIASPIGTIDAPTFNYTRPIGSAIPEPVGFQNVNFDPRSLDAFSWKIDEPFNVRAPSQIEYPKVNRTHKSDRLPPKATEPARSELTPAAALPQLAPLDAKPAAATIAAPSAEPAVVAAVAPAAMPIQPAAPAPAAFEQHAEREEISPAALPQGSTVQASTEQASATQASPVGPPLALVPALATEPAAAVASTPGPNAAPVVADVPSTGAIPRADEELTLDRPPALPGPGETSEAMQSLAELSFIDGNAERQSAAVFFGGGMGATSSLERWAPGAEPILAARAPDSDIKLSALEGTDEPVNGADAGGETIAGKDDVSRLATPAMRLGLAGASRVKAEKCLADAVYFEARGEVLKGQQAVAQVVMNRVFSGYYPHDVCGVVYQNANRHLACQFTFACEGKDLNHIEEPDMWEQAKGIAKDTLDGKIWLAEVGHATHYHAYWVHPSWVHEMTRLYKLGVHTFYRPRNWGDGGEEPVWGAAAEAAFKSLAMRPNPEVTSEAPQPAQKAADVPAKSPQASASPGDKSSIAKL
jgi:hypothetical protein